MNFSNPLIAPWPSDVSDTVVQQPMGGNVGQGASFNFEFRIASSFMIP